MNILIGPLVAIGVALLIRPLFIFWAFWWPPEGWARPRLGSATVTTEVFVRLSGHFFLSWAGVTRS